MKLEDLILNTVIEDGIEYNYVEVNDSLVQKYGLEDLARKSKGEWKVKYKDTYTYIKDGYTVKHIADNRVYSVIQVFRRLFDLLPAHREYELTKDYEYSQIEYWTDQPVWAIAHLFYFKNGKRHNDLGYAEYNNLSIPEHRYWFNGERLTTEEEFKNCKRIQLIDGMLKIR